MESMRWVGVDVHAKESVAAVLNQTTGRSARIESRVDLTGSWTGWPRWPSLFARCMRRPNTT